MSTSDESIFVRPVAGDPVTAPVAWATNIVCLPLWLLNGWLPARYFTTWYHALVIVYLSLALTHTWQADWMAALVWIVSMFVPPSSLVIMFYAHKLRRQLVQTLTWPGFVVQQLVTHWVPSILVWALLAVPHPPPMVGSGCFVAWLTIYCIYLDGIMHETPTDNYFVHPACADRVMVWWTLWFFVACAIGEVLFASGASRHG